MKFGMEFRIILRNRIKNVVMDTLTFCLVAVAIVIGIAAAVYFIAKSKFFKRNEFDATRDLFI